MTARTEARLAASMRAAGVEGAEVALVLGSGLGPFAERIEEACSIPYEELDDMPRSAVPGHAGRLVVGTVGGRRVVAQQGRVHLYEGWSAEEVTRAVRAFAELGVRALVLTNAAGGLRREWPPGTLMRVSDHVNRQGRTPLDASQVGFGSPYDEELGALLHEAAREAGFELAAGVYCGNLGPAYETPAEVELARRFGCDAVGMSTVAEALAAHAAGARVCAVSCITNYAAGITGEVLSHDEVMEVGRSAATRFSGLLEAAVPKIGEAIA